MVTPAALEHEHGRAIAERCAGQGIEVQELKANRLTGLRGPDARETYRRSKTTLAVVVAPPSAMKLQPIPPSADFSFHLAHGCPAHCQYCYLAGSLPGPPVTRAYANLDEILEATADFEGRGTVTSRSRDRADEGTTFEASCYTDPLGIEHLTGSLARSIEHFAGRSGAGLRFTTKFGDVSGSRAWSTGAAREPGSPSTRHGSRGASRGARTTCRRGWRGCASWRSRAIPSA
jgi:spore photoproduct lyase